MKENGLARGCTPRNCITLQLFSFFVTPSFLSQGLSTCLGWLRPCHIDQVGHKLRELPPLRPQFWYKGMCHYTWLCGFLFLFSFLFFSFLFFSFFFFFFFFLFYLWTFHLSVQTSGLVPGQSGRRWIVESYRVDAGNRT